MGWLMDPIYNAISWILLRWHWVWENILPNGTFLGTTWDWVLAIVFLVITVRIILFPIFVKQIRSQRAMQALAPKVKELQAKHKGDQQTLREEMMKLYQTEKVNPLMGCLPLLLQIPVFFGLFRVLSHLNPSNPNKTQYGWSVEQFDSAVVARLFNAPIPARFADSASQLALLDADSVTVKVVAGVLVLIMMLTTFMTSRQMILKTGWSQEPQQRMIQKLMLYGIPISLLLSGWYFPIGVIIYWVVQNIFSLGQQYWVLHKYPPPVTENNIPAKTASERARAAAAASKEPGFLARFFRVLPPAPKPAAGFVGTAQDQTRTGLFRRRGTTAAPPPAADSRSLAPRPGAKPTKATPPAPAGASSSAGSDSTDTAPGSGAKAAADASGAKGTPAKSTPAKTTPAKSTAKATPPKSSTGKTTTGKTTTAKTTPSKSAPSKSAPSKAAPSGSSANGSSTSGSAPTNVTPAGGSSTASPNGASGSGGGAGSAGSGGGRPRSTTKKVSQQRKGQPNRKGGAKR